MPAMIITDSTSNIPVHLLKEYGISIVSLSIVFKEYAVKEIEINNEEFYETLVKSTELPTSSQPSLEEMYNLFKEGVINEQDIIGIFISSEMSGTYSTAHLAKNMIVEKYPDAKIELIDSKSNCMQLGYAAITAARLSKEGKSIDEIVKGAQENLKRSKFIFSPETLEFLKKGGRIGSAGALLGSILNIRPILTVVDGKTHVLEKVRTKKKSLERMVEIFLSDVQQFGLGEVIVHHINNESEAFELAKHIEEKIGKKVDICSIAPVIGVHVGPGTIGIAYYTEQEINN